jgi:hypothetical protein
VLWLPSAVRTAHCNDSRGHQRRGSSVESVATQRQGYILLKESLVRAVGKIATTPCNKQELLWLADTPTFSHRLDLVHDLLLFLGGDARSTNHEFRMELLGALRALALCDPFLPDGDLETLLKSTLDCVMQAITGTPIPGSKASNAALKSEESNADPQTRANELTEAYCGLLCALLLKHVGCFGQVLNVLKVYIASANEAERRVASQALSGCLSELEKQNVPELLAAQTSKWAFQEFGLLVGSLAPRCADPSLAVRDLACASLLSAYSIMHAMTLRSASESRPADDCVLIMATVVVRSCRNKMLTSCSLRLMTLVTRLFADAHLRITSFR